MNEFPPISVLIPHQDPMVLLDQILEWEPGHIECGLLVQSKARFVEDDALAAPFTIEHMAQAVAACLGYEAYRGGRGVRVGMIIACREFKALVPAISVGSNLQIRADRERGSESLSHFHCEVRQEEDVLATATLTLFHGETLVKFPAA